MSAKHVSGLAAWAGLMAVLIVLVNSPIAADQAESPEEPASAARESDDRFGRASSASESGLLVPSVLVKLVEQVSVPARESGVLATVAVEEGHLVDEDELLARIDDAEAQLEKRQAEIELEIARKTAGNDIKVRFAKRSADVARNEYDRGLKARREFGTGAVTDSQLERDRLTWERAVLDIEQSEHEFAIESLTAKLKENALAVAVRNLERRQILSPIAGVVVEVNRRRGEWVEPGEQVFRVLRVDRLRAEGELLASDIRGELVGRRAVLRVSLPGRPDAEFEGKVTFVSPETDPINNKIRFWAEIENPDRLLRPGLQGSLTIDVPTATAARN